jgi:hypothetical protein
MSSPQGYGVSLPPGNDIGAGEEQREVGLSLPLRATLGAAVR